MEKLKSKKTYEVPLMSGAQVMMEKSIADVRISAAVHIHQQEWDDGGTIGDGDTSIEGGDIHLY